MIKQVILIVVFFYINFGFAQSSQKNYKDKRTKYFFDELKFFIDTVKVERDRSARYNVYLAKIYHVGDDKKDFSFTLGHILNQFNLPNVKAQYVLYIGDEIVFINMPKEEENFRKELGIREIQKSDIDYASNKLYPSGEFRSITGLTRGLVFYSRGKKIKKTFYKDSDEIPEEKSVYYFYVPPGSIKQVEKEN